jgi:hypothetical protein
MPGTRRGLNAYGLCLSTGILKYRQHLFSRDGFLHMSGLSSSIRVRISADSIKIHTVENPVCFPFNLLKKMLADEVPARTRQT